MRPTWRIREQVLPLVNWREREVLLAFNGPQLVLLEARDELYLSVASDEDEGAVRWLRSIISNTELRALLSGATTVRDCILKPDILVVDTDIETGAVLFECKTTPEDLCDDDLPATDSFLPEEVVAGNLVHATRPSLILDGGAVIGHAIAFRPLAEVLQHLQRLWNAIGQTILGRTTLKGRVPTDISSKSILYVDALTPGSVGLELKTTDEKLFEDIAAQYQRLVRATDNAKELRALFGELKARVRATYADYIAAVERNDVEVLACWQTQAAFLSPATAARVKPALAISESGEEEQRLELQGFFIAYNLRDATFEFIDKAESERYAGRVSPKVLKDSQIPIVIGTTVDYSIDVTVTTIQAIEGTEKQLVELESVRELRRLSPNRVRAGTA